jgi:hypothetical protein
MVGSIQAGTPQSGRSGRAGPSYSGTFHSQGSTGRLTNSYNSSSNYHAMNAKKFEHGYYYPGKNYNHWSYHCWDKRYGCNVYYDPGFCCYYYYCVPDCCYYPVSYCPYQRYCFDNPAPSAAPSYGSATAIAVATASASPSAIPPALPVPVAGK